MAVIDSLSLGTRAIRRNRSVAAIVARWRTHRVNHEAVVTGRCLAEVAPDRLHGPGVRPLDPAAGTPALARPRDRPYRARRGGVPPGLAAGPDGGHHRA